MPRKKKEPVKKIEKPELLLAYTESKSGGDAIDSEDRWTSHEPEYVDWSPLAAYLDEPEKKARDKANTWYVESLDYRDMDVKIGDSIFVLVVRYQTGGTFGTTHGAWHIEGVYKTSKEASEIEKLIWEDEREYTSGRYATARKKKKGEPLYVGYRGYKCWQGYFEKLESVDVEELVVR